LHEQEMKKDSQLIIGHQDPSQCILQDRHLAFLIFVFDYISRYATDFLENYRVGTKVRSVFLA